MFHQSSKHHLLIFFSPLYFTGQCLQGYKCIIPTQCMCVVFLIAKIHIFYLYPFNHSLLFNKSQTNLRFFSFQLHLLQSEGQLQSRPKSLSQTIPSFSLCEITIYTKYIKYIRITNADKIQILNYRIKFLNTNTNCFFASSPKCFKPKFQPH